MQTTDGRIRDALELGQEHESEDAGHSIGTPVRIGGRSVRSGLKRKDTVRSSRGEKVRASEYLHSRGQEPTSGSRQMQVPAPPTTSKACRAPP